MFSLDRFRRAQDNCGSYDTALQEMRDGYKRTHWIWYVFPQMRGLGHSYNSDYYGIGSLLEAKSYTEDPVLNQRLRDAVLEMTAHSGSLSAEDVLGSLDAKKFRSCLTLFDVVCPQDIYSEALTYLFDGGRCRRTLDLVSDELDSYTGPTALQRLRGMRLDEKAFFESGSEESGQYSMICRTAFLLDCMRNGHSMRTMVCRYLWDRDMSDYRCCAVESSLKEYLLYGVYNNRRLHMDRTLYEATRDVAEEIESTDVLDMADKFDSFFGDMRRNPVLNAALDEFIESY